VKTKHRRDEREQKKLEECGQDVFKLTRIRCRMLWWTEASISYSNLSALATCEHANSGSSPTHLQLMGGGGKAREPGRYSLDAPKPVAPEDPGARAAKPRVILPETPDRGLAPTTSTLVELAGMLRDVARRAGD
jgi:hypothetical protein